MSLLDYWFPLTTSLGPGTVDLYLAEHPGRPVIPASRKNASGPRTLAHSRLAGSTKKLTWYPTLTPCHDQYIELAQDQHLRSRSRTDIHHQLLLHRKRLLVTENRPELVDLPRTRLRCAVGP